MGELCARVLESALSIYIQHGKDNQHSRILHNCGEDVFGCFCFCVCIYILCVQIFTSPFVVHFVSFDYTRCA